MPKERRSAPGERHRQPNGPTLLNVKPVPTPSPAEIGTAHLYTHHVLAGGPRAVIAAQHEAARLSAKFGEEIEAKWCLATKWLIQLTETHRERARYALMWRPRFLAVVSITRGIMLGCRAAKVSKNTVDLHRAQDPDFDVQVLEAQAQAIELLHDVAFRDALEGVLEPVFWQGIQVGHIRKYDNRLRVELLRAHLPRVFKTPGHGGVNVNVGTGAGALNLQGSVIVDAQTRDDLVALRQESLQAMFAARTAAAELEKPAEVLSIRDADP